MTLNNFWQRLLTGIGFVGIISFAVVWNPLTCMSLFLIINIFCLHEFYSLFSLKKQMLYSGLIAGTITYILISFSAAGVADTRLLLFLFPLIFIIFIPVVFNKATDMFHQAGLMLLGIMYISVPLGFFIFSGFLNPEHQYSYHFLLAVLILTWVNDTMAYVSGSLFGRHKFYEKLSPKKTWEGVIGGFVFTVLFSFVFFYFFKDTGWLHWFFLSMIVSVFAFIGDLFESRLKRSLGIKDSGTFFPGHGGFLDRFDAILFVVPFYFFYLYFIIY
jgi:phosphatidate cytidylyltransferase